MCGYVRGVPGAGCPGSGRVAGGSGGEWRTLYGPARICKRHECNECVSESTKASGQREAGRVAVSVVASAAGTLAPPSRRSFLLPGFAGLHVMPLAPQILQHAGALHLLLEGLERPLDAIDIVQLYFDHADSSSVLLCGVRLPTDDARQPPVVIGHNMVRLRGVQLRQVTRAGVREPQMTAEYRKLNG